MLRKRQEKPNIKSQIIKALLLSTNNDPTATVTLKSIVSQALHQINGLAQFPGSKLSKERFIRTTIYKMRKENEIGYEGRNKYKLGPAYRLPPLKFEKLPPQHFKVPPQKRLPETATQLDPAKRRRHSSEESLSSLSGDKFEKARKQFHAEKKLVRHEFNPNLPKARQVNVVLGLPETPSTSGQVPAAGTAFIVIADVPPSNADRQYSTNEPYTRSRSDDSVDGNAENTNVGSEDDDENSSDIASEDSMQENNSSDETERFAQESLEEQDEDFENISNDNLSNY